MIKRILRSPKALTSLSVMLVIVVTAIAAPLVAPHDPIEQDLRARLKPPATFEGGTAAHALGTDSHGRDILSRLIFGARHSLAVAVVAVSVAAIIGVAIGLSSGYFGGFLEATLMRVSDIMLAFPPLILGVAILAVFSPGPTTVSLVIAFSTWAWFARTVRSSVLRIKEMEYIEAARAAGASSFRILLRYVLPTVVPVIIVLATSVLGFAILMEAALSFFGLSGTTLSWGWDIAQGRDFLRQAWWIATAPGLAILFTVIALNTFGDWLRDELDPTLKAQL